MVHYRHGVINKHLADVTIALNGIFDDIPCRRVGQGFFCLKGCNNLLGQIKPEDFIYQAPGRMGQLLGIGLGIYKMAIITIAQSAGTFGDCLVPSQTQSIIKTRDRILRIAARGIAAQGGNTKAVFNLKPHPDFIPKQLNIKRLAQQAPQTRFTYAGHLPSPANSSNNPFCPWVDC